MVDIKVACNEFRWLPVEYLSFPVARCTVMQRASSYKAAHKVVHLSKMSDPSNLQSL
jgi:hypothetical protein